MPAFKYAVFAFELAALPPELRLMDKLRDEFKRLPLAVATSWQQVNSVAEASAKAEDFQALTCGSPFNAAFVNLNLFASAEQLSFLLGESVLGDPRTVFGVSLRGMQGPAYQVAKEKVEREVAAIARGAMYGGPSCIDSYSAGTLDASATRVAQIMHAHLAEEERRVAARVRGTILPPSLSLALDIMRKSPSTYFGRRPGGTSGIFSRPAFLVPGVPQPGNAFPDAEATIAASRNAPPPRS